MMIEMLKEANIASRAQVAEMNKQLMALTGKMIELANRPPQVIETGGGSCTIFWLSPLYKFKMSLYYVLLYI